MYHHYHHDLDFQNPLDLPVPLPNRPTGVQEIDSMANGFFVSSNVNLFV